MRDAPRDVGPGGAALVAQLVGDVVERQHAAVLIAHAPYRQRALAGPDPHQHVGLALIARHEFVEVGRQAGERGALDLFLALLQQRLGRAVDEQDAIARVERDDPGGDARQHRLDEGSAGVELAVGRHQRAGLFLQAPGHAVERGRQRRDFIVGRRHRDARRKIPFFDPARGGDELADRAHQTVGDLERDEDRQADDDQRARQQSAIELQLIGARPRKQGAIVAEDFVGAADLLAELGFEHPCRVDIIPFADAKRSKRANPVRRVDRHARLALELGNRLRRDDPLERPVVGIDHRLRADLPIRTDIDDRRFGQVADIDLAREGLGEARIVDRNFAKITGDIARHGHRFV